MKTFKRVFAGMCALALSLGIASCGNKTEEKAGDTSSVNTVDLNDDQKEQVSNISNMLPDITLKNPTIKFMAHWDINPAEGEAKSAFLEMFEDKYGGKVEYIPTTWNDRYSDLTQAILVKDAPDFIPAMDMDGFPKGAYKGIIQPIDDYINFDDALWKGTKAIADKFTYDGKHYVVCTGASPNVVCIYSRKIINELGLEDPAELYRNGQWTWNKFEELCSKFNDPANDKFAIDGYWSEQGFNSTTNVPLIGLNEKGEAISNIEAPEVVKAQNFLYNLNKKGYYFNRAANNKTTRGDGTTGYGMGEGLTLFIPCGLWGIGGTPEATAVWGSIENGDVMFVPMPRPDDYDTYYVDARLDNAYHLVKNAPNPEGFAAFMACEEAVALQGTNIRNEQLLETYKWTPEMVEMQDEVMKLCNQNPVFDFSAGISDDVSSMMDTLKVISTDGLEPKAWPDVVAEYSNKLDYMLEEVNKSVLTEEERKSDEMDESVQQQDFFPEDITEEIIGEESEGTLGEE